MSTTLYGKKATTDQVRKHIIDLLIGNPSKNIYPMKITDIARRLNLSRETIYQYRNQAIQLGELELDSNGKLAIKQELKDKANFEEFSQTHPIVNDPIIDGWIKTSYSMGFGQSGVSKMKGHINCIQKICNTLKINPIQLTLDFETTEKYAQAFYEKMLNGEISRKQIRKNSNIESAFYPYRMALRHLMQYNQHNRIAIPRHIGGILRGKVVGHGNYADIKLTDEQFRQADEFLIKNFGLDSDTYRIFWFGIETCSRRSGIFSATLDWTEELDEDGSPVLYLNVFESKVKHIKGGKQQKIIERSKTIESLRMAKQRGQNHLWDDKQLNRRQAINNAIRDLKKLYSAIGLNHHYFFEEPIHSLRHLGAHYHLSKTKYNYAYVAQIGHWRKVDELIQSYGEMPLSVLRQMMRDSKKDLNQL